MQIRAAYEASGIVCSHDDQENEEYEKQDILN